MFYLQGGTLCNRGEYSENTDDEITMVMRCPLVFLITHYLEVNNIANSPTECCNSNTLADSNHQQQHLTLVKHHNNVTCTCSSVGSYRQEVHFEGQLPVESVILTSAKSASKTNDVIRVMFT